MAGYAVIDFQTTGLDPARHDRVVEIGVAVLDEGATRVEAWDTLVNPRRDIGETDRHGITARDVLDAPTFAEVAPRLLEAVDGRLIVAHNARFDMLFLTAELERAGFQWRDFPPLALCTMELATLFLPGSARSLLSCCEKAGVDLGQRFDSQSHVRATGELLGWYVSGAGSPPPWAALAETAQRHLWPVWRANSIPLKPRSRATSAQARGWLDRIVDLMPAVGDPDVDAYLAALEMALLDRYLSAREEASLVALADHLGLGRAQVREIHRRYLATMAATALDDGVVTDDERADLVGVAGLLGLDEADVDAALANAGPADRAGPRFALRAGDHIALTGAMQTPRDKLARRAHDLGLLVGSLTKKTRLLVAADPDTSSGKGQKALAYGVPVVTEEAFLDMLTRLEAEAT